MDVDVRKSNRRRTPLILFLCSIVLCSLDFKAAFSGQGFMVQAPVWGFYFLSFSILFLQLLLTEARIREVYFFLLISGSFLVFTTFVGFWERQATWSIFTNFISFFIYITATVFILVVLKLCSNTTAVLNGLKNVCFAFMILHFLMVFFIGGGINLAVSRYEYLSGATIPASAIIVIGAVFHFGLKELFIATANVAIILVSVTRTQLAVILGQLATVFFISPTLIFRPSVIKKALFVFLSILSIIAIDMSADLGLTHRWLSRLTIKKSIGADPTALTRFAENHYMFHKFTDSFVQTFLGNGIAAQTKLTGPSASLAARLVGKGSVTSVHSNGFGHNNHLSVLFVGGLLFGGPLLLLNFTNGFQSFVLIRRLFKLKDGNQELIYIGMWGGLIVIGTLAVGFFSGIFSDRTSCLWYGVGTGMLYWAKEEVRSLSTKMEDDND